MSIAGDLVLGIVEAREVVEDHGLPTVQLLAEIGDLPEVFPVDPTPAVNRVPHLFEVDFQLALAPRGGAS